MKAIADTGFLVAFGNRRDRYHAWAVEIAQRITEPLLTCDAVLAETAFHLGSASVALAFVREGLVRPAFIVEDQIQRLLELAARYSDRKPDLADLCLIRLAAIPDALHVLRRDQIHSRSRRKQTALALREVLFIRICEWLAPRCSSAKKLPMPRPGREVPSIRRQTQPGKLRLSGSRQIDERRNQARRG